jgi:hypothetical protein
MLGFFLVVHLRRRFKNVWEAQLMGSVEVAGDMEAA